MAVPTAASMAMVRGRHPSECTPRRHAPRAIELRSWLASRRPRRRVRGVLRGDVNVVARARLGVYLLHPLRRRPARLPRCAIVVKYIPRVVLPFVPQPTLCATTTFAAHSSTTTVPYTCPVVVPASTSTIDAACGFVQAPGAVAPVVDPTQLLFFVLPWLLSLLFPSQLLCITAHRAPVVTPSAPPQLNPPCRSPRLPPRLLRRHATTQ